MRSWLRLAGLVRYHACSPLYCVYCTSMNRLQHRLEDFLETQDLVIPTSQCRIYGSRHNGTTSSNCQVETWLRGTYTSLLCWVRHASVYCAVARNTTDDDYPTPRPSCECRNRGDHQSRGRGTGHLPEQKKKNLPTKKPGEATRPQASIDRRKLDEMYGEKNRAVEGPLASGHGTVRENGLERSGGVAR